MKYIYLCEDSIDGIFSAVYQAFEEKNGHANNEIRIITKDFNRELFTEYIEVTTDYEKAVKVARTIQQKISYAGYDFVEKAAASYQGEKADAIYRFIIHGLQMGKQVLNHLTAPYMQTLFALERNTNNEIMHLQGFLRFEELANGFLFARINPKNDILTYLAEHFQDRFSGENWGIADTVRGNVVLHRKNQRFLLARMEEVDFDVLSLTYSEEEAMMQELWKRFVDTIAIEERKNVDLQKQMLPLRFRKYMKEFETK